MTTLVPRLVAGLLALVTLLSGCAVKRVAVNQMGNAIAGGGTTFTSDDDPELVKAALPFALKLTESLLAESPRHRGLLLAAASGFTEYSYAFVQEDADETEARDVAAARAMRDRARRLYVRARDYGLRGLEVSHRNFGTALRADPAKAAALATKRDVPLLYWTAAAWGAAISVSKDRPELVADLPLVGTLMERALVLDESFDHGAIHTFLISYELARPGVKPADAIARARQHYERALVLGAGKRAGPYVTWAEQVCVQQQDKVGFATFLQTASAIDADADPPSRLANLVAQRRAKWLLGRADELFAE